MARSLRALVKRSKWALVAYTIARSTYVRHRFARGGIDSQSGSTHLGLTPEASVAYVNRTFLDYLQYGRLDASALRGAVILEAGPGDNLAVALRFAAAGAARVVPMDKFYARQDSAQQRRIYLALREQLQGDERRRYDLAVDLGSGVVFNEAIIRPLYGSGLEACAARFPPASFDLIVSRAVLQEIYDADAAFAAMDAVLRPGGTMIHKIDLRDYGTFSANGHHPLEFLTIPDRIYRWMAHDADRPSRRPFDYYRQKVAEFSYDAQLLVSSVIGPQHADAPVDIGAHKTSLEYGVDYSNETLALVRSIRPRLHHPFRNLSDEDLMVAGFFLVARKPVAGGPCRF